MTDATEPNPTSPSAGTRSADIRSAGTRSADIRSAGTRSAGPAAVHSEQLDETDGDLTSRLRGLVNGLERPATRLADDRRGPDALSRAAERAGLLDVALAGVDSPIGRLALAATGAGLLACSFADEAELAERVARAVSPRVLRAPRRLDPVRRELDDYFEGRRRAFSVPVDLRLATPFAQRVLGALGEVEYGTTLSYGQLAARIGRPSAARAVGHALGANPVCVVLPCHRILGSGGKLTGYAGGVPAKRWLLDLEHAPLQPSTDI
jgi:methylated-DNA-[protein]-cysteine S-methyltransferase